MVDLSVVIVSYNVRELLARCVQSVLEETRRNHNKQVTLELFVIDNASTDGSAAMVREQFQSVCLIENSENRGFASANNQAFGRTSGRYVLMLNPDTEVQSGAFETMVGFLDKQPRAGACGGMLLYGNQSLQHSAFHFPSLAQIWFDFFPYPARFLESRLNGRYPRTKYARGEPFQIDHPLGADMLVRRSAADQVGWLDDEFFIYCEEVDWCIRLKRAGWQVWCIPQAKIVHHEAQSTRQFRDRMFVELWRARVRLFNKHYSPMFRSVARRIISVGLLNAARRARRDAGLGLVTQEELDTRLVAYKEVMALVRLGFGSIGGVS